MTLNALNGDINYCSAEFSLANYLKYPAYVAYVYRPIRTHVCPGTIAGLRFITFETKILL